MVNLTKESIIKVFEENGWEKADFTCPDGTVATVSPCCYGHYTQSLATCEYFLIDWDMPWGGEDNIDDLVKTLNRHEELAKIQAENEKELRYFFEKHQQEGWDDDSFQIYSDWHKDVYGYRPHGYVCGEYVRPY